jgi:hypothetical protein
MNELTVFTSPQILEVAQTLSKSNFIPAQYRNNSSDCLVAIDMANRMRCSVLAIMQNLNVIQGKPSFSAQFLITAVSQCGRYTKLEPEYENKDDLENIRCRAVCTRKSDGKRMEGNWYSMKIAVYEGLVHKTGSKYKSMPEQMLWYRAATLWVSMYEPEFKQGVFTPEEVEVIKTAENQSANDPLWQNKQDKLWENQSFAQAQVIETPPPIVEVVDSKTGEITGKFVPTNKDHICKNCSTYYIEEEYLKCINLGLSNSPEDSCKAFTDKAYWDKTHPKPESVNDDEKDAAALDNLKRRQYLESEIIRLSKELNAGEVQIAPTLSNEWLEKWLKKLQEAKSVPKPETAGELNSEDLDAKIAAYFSKGFCTEKDFNVENGLWRSLPKTRRIALYSALKVKYDKLILEKEGGAE